MIRFLCVLRVLHRQAVQWKFHKNVWRTWKRQTAKGMTEKMHCLAHEIVLYYTLKPVSQVVTLDIFLFLE